MAQFMPKPIRRQAEKETRSAPTAKAVFKAILSEDIDWKPFAAFPPAAPLLSSWVSPRNPDLTRLG